jgi:hypothetical protein
MGILSIKATAMVVFYTAAVTFFVFTVAELRGG